MSTLHIYLEDGFSGQHVSIAVEGRTVYDERSAATDLRISLAAAFGVEAGPPNAHVEVRVEPSGLQASVNVDVLATPYLCIALDAFGAIVFRMLEQMPRYL